MTKQKMVQRFLDQDICIMLSKNEIYLLPDFQNAVDVRWASGDHIDSQCTKNIINTHGPYVYVYICLNSRDGHYMLFSTNPKAKVVSLEEFLMIDNFNADITEEDVFNLLGE